MILDEMVEYFWKRPTEQWMRAAIEAYAAEQVAAETERCALICDNCHTTQGAAERIRARGEKT